MLGVFRSFVLLTAMAMTVSACSGKIDKEYSYPKDPDDVRREGRGKITGDEGWVIAGGREKKETGNSGIGVNAYLWKATLDTLAFMPIVSADPFGGMVITDWYENPDVAGERLKVNVAILDQDLRADALKVSIFKQRQKDGQWRDEKVGDSTRLELEDAILTRARQFKIKDARK